MTQPTIALFTGDPAGIGPELVQKLLNSPISQQAGKIILIAQNGSVQTPPQVEWHEWPGRHSPQFPKAVANADNGAYMIKALAEGVSLVRDGLADAFCFAPLNKSALRMGGMHQEDELRWFAEFLKYKGVCGELNVLQDLWTSRVTSHVALKEVSSLLTSEKVYESIEMISKALIASGKPSPRLAVCGLNPHNGDNGNYGDEELSIIAPGVELAKQAGIPADGPFPADTAFVRAIRKEGGYDGVVTMYHDQGQIAMKLMGFEKGVTVHGGLPIPICTPAHGTAYDIAGANLANPQAMCNAFELACRMGQHHKQFKQKVSVAS
ncbi:MAG: 4-hydroxythreonine-4-phosphate dehydrogenase 2 [Pseudomonadota bacterium]|jgi:4-hydroxy-L-threonine phosphate dehydrogenase PdxA